MKNYYVSSFVWGVLSKILNAIFGVISVPLLLKCFNIEDYGVLTLAISVNAYMHLLDLGINTGSVKYFSQWLFEGKNLLLESVARTSLSFYGIIGIINASILIILSFWGRGMFNISDEQFLILQRFLWIAAFFSVFNWLNSVFSQLLTAAQKISFVHRMMCIVVLLKIILIYVTLYFRFTITTYFFFFSLFLAALIVPYAYLCKKIKIIRSLIPGFEWNKFGIVFSYSLSIFALSFFQMCAASSRPIILGMFASSAAMVVAHYNIVQLMPSFILSINGILSSLLLPKASVIVSKNEHSLKVKYLENGTKVSTILCMSLCCPIIICSKGLLTFVVGSDFIHLHYWLVITILAFCINLPTSTCYSMVLAIGKTRKIVQVTAIFCICSIILNILLAPIIGIGSAIFAYLLFVVGIVFYNYIFYYPKLFNLKTSLLIKPTIKPVVLGGVPAFILYFLFATVDYCKLSRMECLAWCCLISVLWILAYGMLLFLFKEITLEKIKKMMK